MCRSGRRLLLHLSSWFQRSTLRGEVISTPLKFCWKYCWMYILTLELSDLRWTTIFAVQILARTTLLVSTPKAIIIVSVLKNGKERTVPPQSHSVRIHHATVSISSLSHNDTLRLS